MSRLLTAVRHADARPARKVGLALAAALVLTLALAAVVLAERPAPPEPQIPQLPHTFFGKVATSRGIKLPAGTIVTAQAASGGWTGSSTAPVDAASKYGINPALKVPTYDSAGPDGNGAWPGDQIAFYVLGVQARLYDVQAKKWSNTYTFESGGLTELDLSVNISYTITATAGLHGSIDPSGAVKVDYGVDQAFKIKPDSNYFILDVLVDEVSNPSAVASGIYTFTNVIKDHTIAASFVKATYVITPTAGTGCTITPGTPQTVPYKGSKKFDIAANTGFGIDDVKVDGASQGAITTYTFSDVKADHTIEATCKRPRVYLPLVLRNAGSASSGQ